LASKVFAFQTYRTDEEPLSYARLEARCARQCPQSMLRVYVKMVPCQENGETLEKSESKNNSHVVGRYTLKSFYRENYLEDFKKLAAEEEDSFLHRDISSIYETGQTEDELFIDA